MIGQGLPIKVPPTWEDEQGTQREGVELPLVLSTITHEPADLRGKGPSFIRLSRDDVHHYTQGLYIVRVDSRPPPGAVTYFAEIRVIGNVAGVERILAVLAVNSGSGPAIVPFDLGSFSFDFVDVEGRQVTDGVPNNLLTPDSELQVTIVARLYR